MTNLLFFTLFVFQFLNFIDNPIDVLQNKDKVIIDCSYSFDEATSGINIPKLILKNLVLIDVEYFSFDNNPPRGEIIVNKSVAQEIKEIFKFIKKSKFPLGKVIPIVKYNWSDEASMNDNNTSAFNYRNVRGQKILSAHSYGLAIDINPLQNPHLKGEKIISSKDYYNKKEPGTILRDSQLVKEFQKRGWQWGGFWSSSKDYQHFEKNKI